MRVVAEGGAAADGGSAPKSTRYNSTGARVQSFGKTLQLMRTGADNLLEPQLCFFPLGLHGSPDILERRDGESNLGSYHYVVKEIKSSRKIRRKHVMQAAFYNMMLGEIQGHAPEEFYLLNAAGEDAAYSYADYKEEIAGVLSGVADVKGGEMPPVAYGRGVFPWSNYCDRMAVQRDDLSLITGMDGDRRSKLELHGIGTVAALLEADVSGLAEAGIRQEEARTYVARAAALKTDEAARLGPQHPGSGYAHHNLPEGGGGHERGGIHDGGAGPHRGCGGVRPVRVGGSGSRGIHAAGVSGVYRAMGGLHDILLGIWRGDASL